MNYRGNRKYTEHLCCGKGNQGPLQIQSSPKGMTWRQMKIIIQTEGKSELRKEDIKVVFPFRQPHQLLPTAWELEIGREFLGGNTEVFNYQRIKVCNVPLPQAGAEKHLGLKQDWIMLMPRLLAFAAGRTWWPRSSIPAANVPLPRKGDQCQSHGGRLWKLTQSEH